MSKVEQRHRQEERKSDFQSDVKSDVWKHTLESFDLTLLRINSKILN